MQYCDMYSFSFILAKTPPVVFCKNNNLVNNVPPKAEREHRKCKLSLICAFIYCAILISKLFA